MVRHRQIAAAFILFCLGGTSISINALPAAAEQFDLIIVGSGLAGLSAALEAGRSGAKVLVVDEASIFGGHAIMSEGELNIVDSPFQRSRGVQDSPGLAFTDFTRWGEDNERRCRGSDC